MASVDSWDSIFTLILFIITNAVMLFPVSLHICYPYFVASIARHLLEKMRITSVTANQPSNSSHEVGPMHRVVWARVRIDFRVAPIAAVLLLLATTVINGPVLRDGIVGTDGVHPLDIMALFISLAYLSVSLDSTGLLRYLAFKVARKGGASGRKLHLYLYIFFLVAALVVGNDPVVLSGTAFLAYFTRVAGIVPPTAWTYAQFAAANMASAVLPPSNPTNLVLTSTFSTPFTTFAGHTVLPVLASSVVVYPLMTLWVFRSPPNLIPHELDVNISEQGPQELERRTFRENSAAAVFEQTTDAPGPDEISDKVGAILGTVLLIGALVVLVATSPLPRPIPVWRVTVPPALIMLGYDVWSDLKTWKRSDKRGSIINDDGAGDEIELNEVHRDTKSAVPKSQSIRLSAARSFNKSRVHDKPKRTLESLLEDLSRMFPTITTLLPRLPVSLVPFALSMFILVNALASKGWVEVFARWWRSWVNACLRSGGETGAVFGAAGLMAIISVLLCNVCGTNIGATILLARILKSWVSSSSPPSLLVTVSLYTLALGSNYGAFSLHLGASLAGLLWRDILWRKGISTRNAEFARLNVWIVVAAMIVGTGVVIAEAFVAS